jgi:hypothetical protein
MPDAFPFAPIPNGNICSGCCAKCTEAIKKNKDVRCCKEGVAPSFNDRCFDPADNCEYCKILPDQTRKLTKICTDPDQPFYLAGKTTCCFGECYNQACYACKNKAGNGPPSKGDSAVVFKEDADIWECCIHPTDSKLTRLINKNDCERCINGIVKQCADYDPANPTCCNGSGSCYNTKCDKCIPDNTNSKKTHKVDKKCKNPKEGFDCCADKCWDSSRDKCRECKDAGTPNESLQTKPNCSVCCEDNATPISNKQCCGPNTKCCENGEEKGSCYDPKCGECE